ncbi:Ig-like domain-containing protein [Pontibacter sp. E15-1]|uniref:Ig-like domain-containing protein n=1 Tax=Pontibacter sp. E15-1 TaxID=2919918 RepID=UPI001F4FE415|nr:Ig-like domain-containing protein [Pontibacter sp. E15-1]MCJ8166733.1 Ig-like domain-containing protein [Pontibacter sp. E15-1]
MPLYVYLRQALFVVLLAFCGSGVVANPRAEKVAFAISAPQDVQAKPSLVGAITISWSPVSGATSYEVEKSTTGQTGTFIRLQTVAAPTTTFRHTGLYYNQKVYYRVKAINGGDASPYSIVVSGTTHQQGKVYKIMPLGDSNTEGGSSAVAKENKAAYRDKLADLLDASRSQGLYDFVGSESTGSALMRDTDHAGFGGARDEDIALLLKDGRFEFYSSGEYRGPGNGPYLDKYNPDIILLHIGTNWVDGSANAMTDIKNILDQVDAYEARVGKEVTVIVAKIIKRVCYEGNCETPTEAQNTLQFNQMLASYTAQRIAAGDRLELVDMQDGAGIIYKYVADGGDMADYLHPAMTGYNKMAPVWYSALDKLLNVQPTAPDTQAPQTSITVKPKPDANSSAAAFTFSSDESGVTYQISVDGGAFVQATNPITLNNLADGPHTLQVRAIDAAGNIDQSPAAYTWTIDTKAPAAPVLAAPTDGAFLATDKPTFSGTAEEGSTVTVLVDGTAIGTTTATNANWSLVPTAALADGTHKAMAKATDAAGNESPVSNTNTFTVDATTPDTKIETAPAAITNQKTAAFTFSSNRQYVTYEASLDGAAFATVSNPLNLSSLSDGSHTLRVRAKNQAGTLDPSPATHTWVVDTQAPAAPLITAPAADALLNTNKPAFSGSAEAGSNVALYIGGNQIGSTTAATDGTWRFVPATALAEGTHQLTAKATDAATNTSAASATRTFMIDSKAPETTVVEGPDADSNSKEARFSFSSNEAGVTFWVSLDGAAYAATTNPYTASNLQEGPHTLSVRAVDAAGNTDASPASYSWRVDTQAPEAPVLLAVSEDRGPQANDQVTSDNSLVLSGRAEANATVTLSEKGTVLGTTKANATGNWSFSYEATALVQNTYLFKATATDAAGNTSAGSTPLTVIVDLTAPEATVSKAANAPLNAPYQISITFTEDVYTLASADFSVTNGTLSNLTGLTKASYTATVTPAADGAVQVKLPAGKVTDLAGNLNKASNQLESVYDATRPRLTISSEAPSIVNTAFTATFAFSEDVTGFELSDITLLNGTARDFATVNGSTYTARIVPTADGEVHVQVNADMAFDAAKNGNIASALLKRTYDVQQPTVVLSTTAPNPTKAPFTVTVSFSEPVLGFTAESLSLTNASASQLSKADAQTYTVRVTPAASGEVAVSLAANSVQDAATNGNQASNQLKLLYDADRPAISLTTTAPGLTNAPFTVTFNLSESVTGFDLADITHTNASVEKLEQVSELVYTARIIPAQNGKVTVLVPADKMQDAATNGNTPSNILELTYDGTAPTGYTVRFGVDRVDVTNQRDVNLLLDGTEKGTTYTYTLGSSNGGTPLAGTGRVEATSFSIASLDLSSLRDGTLTVTLFLTDDAGNKGQEVTAQVEKLTKNVELVQEMARIKVLFKTAFKDVPLPNTAQVTYTNGETETLTVTWQKGTYNGSVPGTYTLTGVLELKENTSNIYNKTASIVVEVAPNQPPTAIALSKSTFRPDIESFETIGTLSTTDPDDEDFTYALVPGEGGAHNQLFELSKGNELTLRSNLGLSGVSKFTIRVRSTDPYKNSIEQSFTLTKTLYQPQEKIKLVNAFSPDGDGINDTWTVPELRYYNAVEVEVFDRAGVRLFHTTDPEEGWDGRSATGRVLPGSYFYIIRIKDIDLVQKGVLTVLN